MIEELYRFGLTPEIEIDQESQSTEQTIVVPWMILNVQDNASLKASPFGYPFYKKIWETPQNNALSNPYNNLNTI